MGNRGTRVARERAALAAHRAALRGSPLPAPEDTAKGTFVHGFLLPFSIIAATLRDRELRGPYLRVALVRGLVVALVGVIAIAAGGVSSGSADRDERPHRVLTWNSKGEKPAPRLHVAAPGVDVDIDEEKHKASVTLLGKSLPVEVDEDEDQAAPGPPSASAAPAAAPTMAQRVRTRVRHGWAWALALVAVLSATEGVVVFFSRRWDDWLSFHASRLVAIRPEDENPQIPKLGVDVRWLYRKGRRRLRGYLVFAAGLPALLPLRLLPSVGGVAFTLAATLWGWYWLGVFSAAKSAHAWADEENAPPPLPIRRLHAGASTSVLFGPLRGYVRLWARITRGVNPAAATFERSPTAFLGLALARVILSLPGLYLLARPIVPTAAGRLCAEADPAQRFWSPLAGERGRSAA